MRATLGAHIDVRSDGIDGETRSMAIRKAERAKDAFLKEVRTELGIDDPTVDTTLPARL